MNLALEAQTRVKKGKQVRALRSQGNLPAVLYGREEKPVNLSIPYGKFERVWHKSGKTTLVDVTVDNHEPTKVLIHDIQYHPVTDKIIHVDFYKVKLTEKITATIPVHMVNEDEVLAVKELQGSLIINKNEIEVEAYPQDLVPAIEVDVSALKTFDDVIHVKDLVVPKGIEIITDPEEVVVLIQPPRSEEELAELEEKPVEDVEAVAVEEKGEKEEETAEAEVMPTDE